MTDLAWIALASLLLLAGAGLIILEFFVVSGGLIAIAAIGCAAGAVAAAFQVGASAGWAFAAAVPVVGVACVRWALTRVQQTSLVTQAEITADAGYRHATEALGIAIGSRGVLVTHARPTGRARFDGGECDVQSAAGPLDKGIAVAVVRIDGPTVFVTATAPVPSQSP